MSASAQPNDQTTSGAMPVPSRAQFFFWNDESVDLNDRRLKKNIPGLPEIKQEIQVVRGSGFEKLAYLALQVVKTQDKLTVIRAISSACSVLLDDSTNFTGSPKNSVELTGLERASDEKVADTEILVTNFQDAEPVTVAELLNAMEGDIDELGAYFGVLFLAGTKRIDARNRTAFNEKRQASATASIIGKPRIFVDDSMFLADAVLEKVYASFLSCQPLRSNMISRVVFHLNKAHMGPALAFATLFLLLVDSGLSALRIIKEAVLKHPWIRTDFPELRPELSAANVAQSILRTAPGHERSFVKAIHGSNFVPVNYSEIDNLTGVCKEILKRTTPSYQNYGGGRITEFQLNVINAKLGTDNQLVLNVSAD
jgi:hypothetical protein